VAFGHLAFDQGAAERLCDFWHTFGDFCFYFFGWGGYSHFVLLNMEKKTFPGRTDRKLIYKVGWQLLYSKLAWQGIIKVSFYQYLDPHLLEAAPPPGLFCQT
jgi:hypothetical protein